MKIRILSGKSKEQLASFKVNFGFLVSPASALVMEVASGCERDITNMMRMKMTAPKGSFPGLCLQDSRSLHEGLLWDLALYLEKVKREHWEDSRAKATKIYPQAT